MNYIIEKLLVENNEDTLLEPGIYTFLNPFSYLILRKTIILNGFNGIYIDGISLVKCLSVFDIHIKRKSFDMTSLAPIVFNKCVNNNKSIYFIGSEEESIKSFVSVIKEHYSKLNILGFRNGYFENKNQRIATLNEIYKINPDVIICGMGTPHQEMFLIDLKSTGWDGVGYTCGGFIHQTTKNVNYYPNFFNKFNLRWLYRIIDEPKLFKRYFVFYPKAIFYIVLDLFRYKYKM